jgi:hypothetical protein
MSDNGRGFDQSQPPVIEDNDSEQDPGQGQNKFQSGAINNMMRSRFSEQLG